MAEGCCQGEYFSITEKKKKKTLKNTRASLSSELLLWRSHSSALLLLFLFFCIPISGAVYQTQTAQHLMEPARHEGCWMCKANKSAGCFCCDWGYFRFQWPWDWVTASSKDWFLGRPLEKAACPKHPGSTWNYPCVCCVCEVLRLLQVVEVEATCQEWCFHSRAKACVRYMARVIPQIKNTV